MRPLYHLIMLVLAWALIYIASNLSLYVELLYKAFVP
ncbi:hypothetical protein Pogu_1312 [Pyrobaculum oguniense TE7]|uniref:Uncharacterized protein n=1 Tax=Pyrobaculum oguniense (strain DSM 13380 / JCM 10595 / TE7) TaxID=698757 RepID=H6QAD8_PYROT|nr:hypothetical protein Pogu_1312 [Pyrobaculum oguniense TE7]